MTKKNKTDAEILNQYKEAKQKQVMANMAQSILESSDEGFALEAFQSLKQLGSKFGYQLEDSLIYKVSLLGKPGQYELETSESPSVINLAANLFPKTLEEFKNAPLIKALSSIGVDWNKEVEMNNWMAGSTRLSVYGENFSPMSEAARSGNLSTLIAISKSGGRWLGNPSADQIFDAPLRSPFLQLYPGFNEGSAPPNGADLEPLKETLQKEAWEELSREVSLGRVDKEKWVSHIGAAILTSFSENFVMNVNKKNEVSCWQMFLDETQRLGAAWSAPLRHPEALESYLNVLNLGQLKEPTLALALVCTMKKDEKSLLLQSLASMDKDFPWDPRSLHFFVESQNTLPEGANHAHRNQWLKRVQNNLEALGVHESKLLASQAPLVPLEKSEFLKRWSQDEFNELNAQKTQGLGSLCAVAVAPLFDAYDQWKLPTVKGKQQPLDKNKEAENLIASIEDFRVKKGPVTSMDPGWDVWVSQWSDVFKKHTQKIVEQDENSLGLSQTPMTVNDLKKRSPCLDAIEESVSLLKILNQSGAEGCLLAEAALLAISLELIQSLGLENKPNPLSVQTWVQYQQLLLNHIQDTPSLYEVIIGKNLLLEKSGAIPNVLKDIVTTQTTQLEALVLKGASLDVKKKAKSLSTKRV